MMMLKNRIIHLLIIVSAIIVIDFITFGTALSENNTEIIIGENLKPGMTLKDAIDLLGPPEKFTSSGSDLVIMHYDSLGLSIEVMNGRTAIERIQVQPSFKGQFASGIEMGADYKKILSVYGQPDMMTKEIIEYSDPGLKFQIHEGKLAGANLSSGKSSLYSKVMNKDSLKDKNVAEEIPEVVNQELREEVKEELREELREEVREELREEVQEEVINEFNEEFDVFDLFGFKVRQDSGKVIITEIRPGSLAEQGNLKEGEPVRRVFYDGAGKLNIYSVKGLKKFLTRAVNKRKKFVYVLQVSNKYYKIEVPERR